MSDSHSNLWERDGDGTFNIENPDHKKLIEVLEAYVKRKGTVWEKDIASDIIPALEDKGLDLKYTYVRRLLREGGRQYLEDQNVLEILKVPTGGREKIKYKAKTPHDNSQD